MGGGVGFETLRISKAIYREMESKKNLQFNDYFEILFCVSQSHMEQ